MRERKTGLSEPQFPAPGTGGGPGRRSVLLLLVALAALAAVRFQTMAIDPWEWDELLFVDGVRQGLDVRVNHPHPPGYPLLVYAGQALSRLGLEPFRATTVAGVLGGLGAVVGLGALVLALGAPLPAAFLASLLYAFIPAVWLHGVRPLTDGMGAAAFHFAAAAFVWSFRRSSRETFVVAVVLSALGAGVRPQVAALLLPVAAVSAWPLLKHPEGRKAIGLAALLGVALSCLIWIPVVRSSGGWEAYRLATKAQADYVREFDTIKAPELLEGSLWKRWWIDPFGVRGVAKLMLGAAFAGFLACRRKGLILIGLFALPVATSMIVLSRYPAPRYAAVFLGLPAALIALGIDRLGAAPKGRLVAAAAGAALVGLLALTALAPVLLVPQKASPPVAAMRVLGTDPAWIGRPVVAGGSLAVHVQDLLPGRAIRMQEDDVPMQLAEGEAVVIADGELIGEEAAARFRFDDPLLSRISRGRYLSVSLYRARPDIGLALPRGEGNGWWDGDHGIFHAGTGSALTVVGPLHPLTVEASVLVPRDEEAPTRFRFETWGSETVFQVAPGERRDVQLLSSPEPGRLLFRLRCLSGRAEVSRLRFTLRKDFAPVTGVPDISLPVAVDEPRPMAEVRGLLRVRGWCQQLGGGAIDPVEFRLDGVLLEAPTVARTPRPDVAAAVPAIGDARRAGWETVITPGTIAPGDHSLVVVFRTPDGRVRRYDPVPFRWVGASQR